METQWSTIPKPSEAQQATRSRRNEAAYAGYGMLALSFGIFLWKDTGPERADTNMMAFFVHYFIAITYAGYLLLHGALGLRRSWQSQHINSTTTLLTLFLISAYALNREVTVFYESTPWLCVFLVLTSLSILSFRYFETLPAWVNRCQYLVLGTAIVLYGYLTVLLSGIYVFGTLGTLALGIGAHVFVPALMLTACVFLVRHYRRRKDISVHWATVGASAACLVVLAFVAEWSIRVSRVEKLVNESVLSGSGQRPTWVSVSEYISDDWITQRMLKSDLVYRSGPKVLGDAAWSLPRLGWNETRQHDPLVFLATLQSRSTLSEEERIKILKAIANARHQAEERLWSGEHLTTSYIVTDVDIYPELRIAYTERYFTIRNNEPPTGRWVNNEEALYTFQLPEGSVVSSLSLWINGVEEKGILTSKGKADKAYKTIVGVELRDPSVVHWQEGNTVTVRVFPCTNKEERKFKIGVTTPLPVQDGWGIYRSIKFHGPDAAEAKETIRITIRGDGHVAMPNDFTTNEHGEFMAERSFTDDLVLSFPAVPVRANNFTFAGYTYSIDQHTPVFQNKSFEDLYLDINHTWTEEELSSLQGMISKYKIFVHESGFTRLTPENWRDVTRRLTKRNFSLFPFHILDNVDNALVITKGDAFTPHLSDFSESAFAKNISNFFADGTRVNVFNFGDGISTYINSLREFRSLILYKGSEEVLIDLLTSKRFIIPTENEDTVVIPDASLAITRRKTEDSNISNNAPDHLARLFAYNNIMRRIGRDYFKGDFSETLVADAASAYVVTPVSSLIVPESREDYERFEIKDTDDSLFNATRASSGAVPEPHEWALIILFVLFVLYAKLRH